MRICLIGSGNVATHLGMALLEKGHQVVQVWSHTAKHAEHLGSKLHCTFTSETDSITSDTDIYLISIKDDTMASLLPEVNWKNKLVLHTAGSIPMDILAPYCENFGVLYPFQTISAGKEIDFEQVPIFIEANTTQNFYVVNKLAQSISHRVNPLDSAQRQQIHLAAVFACNFVNHFYGIAMDLLAESGIDFEILKPLILETAKKVISQTPQSSQTGPASRNDKVVMDKHLAMLTGHPDLKELYQQISQRIIQTHNI